jgi:hypothetical protein
MMNDSRPLSTHGKHHQPDPLENPSTQRRLASIIAVTMVLPALGMIAGGFAFGRLYLGDLGLALMVGLGIGYYVILKGVLKRFEE